MSEETPKNCLDCPHSTITIEEDLDLNELKKSIDSFFETKELEEK